MVINVFVFTIIHIMEDQYYLTIYENQYCLTFSVSRPYFLFVPAGISDWCEYVSYYVICSMVSVCCSNCAVLV